MVGQETSVYGIIQAIQTDFRRLGITDTGSYTETLAMEICKSLGEGVSKDVMYERLKKTDLSTLIVPRGKSLDRLFSGIVNRFYGANCDTAIEDSYSTGVVTAPKSEFSAYLEVIRIIKESEVYLKVIDAYPSSDTLIALSSVEPAVLVCFLTYPPQGSQARNIFEVLVKKFMRDYPHTDVRYAPIGTLHDRYLISPKRTYLLGHSIKDIGNKLSTITPLSVQLAKSVEKEFDALWSQSSSI